MSLCLHSIGLAPIGDLWTSLFAFPFLVTQYAPTVAQWIMSHCAMLSGTYCSFASDEPCPHFLDYHSYLACLYLPFKTYKFPPELPCPISHLFPILYHFVPQPYCLYPSHTRHYHTWRQSLTPWPHPQSLIGFTLRFPAPSNLSCTPGISAWSPHLTHSPHPISCLFPILHHFAVSLSLPVMPHPETIPYPLITPSEPHWVYTLIEPSSGKLWFCLARFELALALLKASWKK